MSRLDGPEGPDSPAKGSCMFYKLMVASILKDKKLKIPEKFVKKYGDELSSIATLTVPNGRIWLVELEKKDGKLWFHNGWHEFVEYYSVRLGYFLVFKYGGDSNFNTYIFDLTVSEIRYPCNLPSSLQEKFQDNQNIAEKKHLTNDRLMEILGSGSTSHSPGSNYLGKYGHCTWTPSGNYEVSREGLIQRKDAYDVVEKFHSYRDIGVQFNESELTSTADKFGLSFMGEADGRTRKRRQITDPNKYEPKIKQKAYENSRRLKITSESLTRRWRPVTPEEKQRTISTADMFKPNNPFFRVILRPSYVYRGFLLHIPNDFAQKYLVVTRYIKLQVSKGKEWPVRCVCGHGKAKLCKGWTEFVWENGLEEGDVCVFELVNTMDILLKVTIFRVLEDVIPVNQLPMP